jgi:hypothetical protein
MIFCSFKSNFNALPKKEKGWNSAAKLAFLTISGLKTAHEELKKMLAVNCF